MRRLGVWWQRQLRSSTSTCLTAEGGKAREGSGIIYAGKFLSAKHDFSLNHYSIHDAC